jgi:hypothetical protein
MILVTPLLHLFVTATNIENGQVRGRHVESLCIPIWITPFLSYLVWEMPGSEGIAEHTVNSVFKNWRHNLLFHMDVVAVFVCLCLFLCIHILGEVLFPFRPMRESGNLRTSRRPCRSSAVRRWLPTAAARVRVRAACRVRSGQSGTGAGFLRVLRFPLPISSPISPLS